jgi:hypothetical protein
MTAQTQKQMTDAEYRTKFAAYRAARVAAEEAALEAEDREAEEAVLSWGDVATAIEDAFNEQRS